ncbi:uncharacterized protein LOC105698489 [Orussus abietinus]|uniref:uncharacterized protein LOC105698489 n=1 Tax=Orussus abietinus TaxID=222816 RepID=UPI000625235B|nr:uncharacterized protein LOC105698489 [Orussus abietinus]
MAEAAAKREARKRRILENSENRLQRIRSNCEGNNYEGVSNDVFHGYVQSGNSKLQCKGLSVLDAVNGKECAGSLIDGIDSDLDGQYFGSDTFVDNKETSFSQSSVPHRFQNHRTMRDDTYIDGPQYHLTSESQANSLAFVGQCYDNGSQNDLKEPTVNISLLYLLRSQMIYILLAAIANVLLLSKLDDSFGMTIVIPYFVTALGQLLIHDRNQESYEGKLLVAALILCNVKPDLIYRIKALLTLVRRILENFAIYIFSFVLIRSIIAKYWYDFGTVLYVNQEDKYPVDT